MTSKQNELQLEKYNDRKFSEWLLEVAPPTLIGILRSNGKTNNRKFHVSEKTPKVMLRKLKLEILNRGQHLTTQVINIADFLPVFEWCYRPEDELKGVKVKDQDVSATIRERYEESDEATEQELALQLFVNNAFEQAYELYEAATAAQPEEKAKTETNIVKKEQPLNEQEKTIKHLRKMLIEFESKLKKAESAEKEAKAAQQQAEEHYQTVKKQLKDQKKKEDSGKADKNKLFEENQTLKQRLANNEEERQQKIAQLKQQKEALQKELSNVNWELEKIKEDYQSVQAHNTNLQRIINDLNAQNNTYKQQLEQQGQEVPVTPAPVVAKMPSTATVEVNEQLIAQLQQSIVNKDVESNRLFEFIPAKEEEPAVALQPIVSKPVAPQLETAVKTYDFAILGNPKTATRKVTAEKREKFAIYEASEQERFIAEYAQYKGAILFEMRCDRKMFEAIAPAYVKQTIKYAETPTELQKLMEDM